MNHPRTWIVGGLMLMSLMAYEGVRRCGFVDFDDDIYVFRNPHVVRGLTWAGVRWAFEADLLFESPHADYWMPLTILSRMLDVELFGSNPGGHHATNALLHAINVALLFLMLDRMTSARWPSAFAAAVLAVHPLTVESVAWVTERKEVLAALFWMLSLIAYGRYVRLRCWRSYAAAAVFMALGLMAKPTLVALPPVLLVLDFWPLRRFARTPREHSLARILLEKLPFGLLAVVSGCLTLLAHFRGGHLASADALPFAARAANALWSLVLYLGKVVWPAGLAVFYPHPGGLLVSWRTGVSVSILSAFSWLAARNARRRPYLLAGGLWYLFTLAPVLGLVQTGQQARADRFMYLPLVGIGILLAWSGAELASASRGMFRAFVPCAATVTLLLWIGLTRAQVRTWENTLSLFSRAVAVSEGSHLAHNNLATALAQRGELAAAERHYGEALAIRGDYWEAHTGLGVVLMKEGRLAEALVHQREALRLNPSSAAVNFSLGALEARLGRHAEAEAHYARALRSDPNLAAAHYNWGNLLVSQGRLPEAETHFKEAARLQPSDVEVLNNLGLTIGLQGRWPEAAGWLMRAVGLAPRHVGARMSLARALRQIGRVDEARAQWQEALRIEPAGPAAEEARNELRRLAATSGR